MFPGKSQKIYTDNGSKVKKYQRIMVFLIILVPVFLSALILTSIGAISDLMVFVMVIILLSFAYAEVRLLQRIGQLRAKT